MKREQLISEVKEEYAILAELEKRDNYQNLSSDNLISSDKYYEFVLDKVINMISYGAFDQFSTGKEVVRAVTNNKNLVFEKWNTDISKTNSNLEIY